MDFTKHMTIRGANAALAALGFVLAGAAMPDASASDKPAGTRQWLIPGSCEKPAWPQEMLAAKRTGTVTLALLIGGDGKVKQAKVTQSSGYPELDEAARAGIAKCSFVPGMIDGNPTAAWLQMQYVWRLD